MKRRAQVVEKLKVLRFPDEPEDHKDKDSSSPATTFQTKAYAEAYGKIRAQDVEKLQALRFPDEPEVSEEEKKKRNDKVLKFGNKAADDMCKRSEQIIQQLVIDSKKERDEIQTQELLQKSKHFPDWYESTDAHLEFFKNTNQDSSSKSKGPKFVPLSHNQNKKEGSIDDLDQVSDYICDLESLKDKSPCQPMDGPRENCDPVGMMYKEQVEYFKNDQGKYYS